MSASLKDRRILVVEDDFFLALGVKDALTAIGAKVVGPESRLAPALAIARSAELGGAVLDVRINRDTTEEVAAVLIGRSIPLILVTGYDAGQLPAALQGVPRLGKPVDAQSLQRAAVEWFSAG